MDNENNNLNTVMGSNEPVSTPVTPEEVPASFEATPAFGTTASETSAPAVENIEIPEPTPAPVVEPTPTSTVTATPSEIASQYSFNQPSAPEVNTVNDNTNNTSNVNGDIPEEYKPISMWGYLGYEILFCIPCVGLILLFVFAFGNKNINVKNFARSYLLLIAISLGLTIIASIFFAGIISSIINNLGY